MRKGLSFSLTTCPSAPFRLNQLIEQALPKPQLPDRIDFHSAHCETLIYPQKRMVTRKITSDKHIVTVGVTGASGAILAQKALQLLVADPRVERIHLVITETGQRLLAEELGITSGDLKQLPDRLLSSSGGGSQTPATASPNSKIKLLPNKDVGASIASGSYNVDSMLIIPCSMGTLGSIANGLGDDLVARAADVMLKEGRHLILCVRDTPFNRIHLENMLRAQQAGAVIMPAVPSFYDHPKTIDDLVTQYVCRVLARIGLPQEQMYRWPDQKNAHAPASKKAQA
ncbi:MAG: hypothetical protein NVS9B4_15160 [Candidatus Acidiferrum sp.]